MKILAVDQQGGGCDYTIACGTRVRIFDVPESSIQEVLDAATAMLETGEVEDDDDENLAQAIAYATMRYVHRDRWGDDYTMTLYALLDFKHEVDYTPLAIALTGREQREKDAANEAAERAEFERLQKKYG